MFYEVLVNGVTLGVYGHPNVKNMHISVMVTANGPEVFANAVCADEGDLYLYDWLQQLLSPTDTVEIRQTTRKSVPEPRVKYKMRRDDAPGAN